MRRALKIAAGVVGLVALIYALAVAMFAWQLRIITDVSEYEDLMARWKPALVQHFPRHVPDSATMQSLSSFPGFLQGGAHLQLRVALPAIEISREEERVSRLATQVYRNGQRLSPDQVSDVMLDMPLPHFYTADEAPTASFPEDYSLYVLFAQPGESYPWNHGRTAGVAVSRRLSELVYWAESW